MTSTPSILIVGSINFDMILGVDACPAAGETVVGVQRSCAHGGKGANQAVAAARLGAKVSMVGKVGNDSEGRAMKDALRSEGIDTGSLATDPELPSGLAAIVVEASGQNRIMIYPGANRNITTDMIDSALEDKTYDALMLQLEIEPEMSIYAAKKAQQAGIPVILDPAPAQKFEIEKFGKLFMITPNETEAQNLTDVVIQSFADAQKAAQILYRRCACSYTVIKMGDKGSLLYDGNNFKTYEPVPVTAVDTTAAGDAFNAALVYEYFKTKDIDKAMRFAGAVGAFAVTRNGAQTSLPTRKQVEMFYK